MWVHVTVGRKVGRFGDCRSLLRQLSAHCDTVTIVMTVNALSICLIPSLSQVGLHKCSSCNHPSSSVFNLCHVFLPPRGHGLDVKHCVSESRMDLYVPILQVGLTTRLIQRVKDPAVPASAPLARQVGIVDRWRDADGCCGSTEQVAHVVRYAVEEIGSVLEPWQ